MKKRFSKKNIGFTLIEIIIYIFIFSFMSVALINSIVNLSESFAIARLNRTLQTEGLAAMSRMSYELRESYTVDTYSSVFGTSSDDVTVSQDQYGTNNTMRMYISNGKIYLEEDGVEVGPITSDNVTVDEFTFNHIVTAQGQAVRLSLSLSASQGSLTRSKDFNTTVVLRESY